ncbi:MAG: hypothetical protein ABGW81_09240, partial [Paracoccaceae bacterium]
KYRRSLILSAYSWPGIQFDYGTIQFAPGFGYVFGNEVDSDQVQKEIPGQNLRHFTIVRVDTSQAIYILPAFETPPQVSKADCLTGTWAVGERQTLTGNDFAHFAVCNELHHRTARDFCGAFLVFKLHKFSNGVYAVAFDLRNRPTYSPF